MVIKFQIMDDLNIISIPENVLWRLVCPSYDESGNYDYGLYIIVDGDKILLRDANDIPQANKIPMEEIGKYHREVLHELAETLLKASNEEIICLEKIEEELLDRYINIWIDEGYITLNKDGSLYY